MSKRDERLEQDQHPDVLFVGPGHALRGAMN